MEIFAFLPHRSQDNFDLCSALDPNLTATVLSRMRQSANLGIIEDLCARADVSADRTPSTDDAIGRALAR